MVAHVSAFTFQTGEAALRLLALTYGTLLLTKRRCQPFRETGVLPHQLLESDASRRRQEKRSGIGVAHLTKTDEAGVYFRRCPCQFIETRRHIAGCRQVTGV